MRTIDEIIERLHTVAGRDPFGTESSDLLVYLPFEKAKEFLKEEVTSEQWAEIQEVLTRAALLKEMREYFPFALEKCLDHRGLSAGRSISHYLTWFWLLEDAPTVAFLEDGSNYAQYGAPMLKKVAEVLGIQIRPEPTFERMAAGEICIPGGCPYNGCGL